MSNRFLFFGCWNSGGCKVEDVKDKSIILTKLNSNPLTRVMKHLKEFVENNNDNVKPEFLIVAGDNYYPPQKEEKKENKTKEIGEKEKTEKKQKKKENKKYIENDIKSGFECLDEIQIEKIILLGNHDVEQTIYENKENKECNTLKYQKKRYNNLFNFNNFDKEETLQYKMVGVDTIIIMFDSTIYDIIDDEVKSKDFLDCYKLLNNTNSDFLLENIQSLITLQNNQRDKTIDHINKNVNIKNIIFTCHHPIIEIKTKEDKLKETPLEKMVEFLFPFQEIKDKKFYHLCADVHLYQSSDIKITKGEETMEIKQYVVGTGGAKLDDDNKNIENNRFNNPRTIYKENYHYTYTYKLDESKPTNGFLDCKVENNEIKFTFIDINNPILQPEPTAIILPPGPPAPPSSFGGFNKKKYKFITKKRKRNKKRLTRKYRL